MDTGCVQVVVAIDTEDGAERIAERLVDGRLAACVQVAGPVTSRYRWEGRVEVAREFLLVAKTVERRVDALIAAVRDEHPYDVPEITGSCPSPAAWPTTSTGSAARRPPGDPDGYSAERSEKNPIGWNRSPSRNRILPR